MKRLLYTTLILTILLASCAPALPGSWLTPSAPWWREAVFYEIFVRSYYDSDCDGIGDFNGITQKLDYIESLGVDAIWLMPIHPSPSYHGYDVINYYAVNSEYGSMEDFKTLLAEAHKRDIKIIIDLVINHTSTQHPWFQDANRSPESAYRDWYVWSDENPGNLWHAGNTDYYYGYFWGGMPDLNYTNRAVSAQMFDISDYWLEQVGVDGFRIDAAKHLIEADGKIENTPQTTEWFRKYYSVIKTGFPNAYTVGEIYGAGGLLAKQYEGQMDHIFNFELASGMVNSVAGGANSGINSAYAFTLKEKPDGDYATFLTNHDQNRVMTVLGGDIQKAKLAATLLLTAPGTPFLYYGEEIGMQGQKPDEDIRLPMQWDATVNAGFACRQASAWRAPHETFKQVNVAKQNEDPSSLLNHYRALINLRQEYPALQTGETTILETGNRAVFAMTRVLGDQTILVVVNLGNAEVTEYGLSGESALWNGLYQATPLLGAEQAASLEIAGAAFSNYKPVETLMPLQGIVLNISR